MGIKLIKKKNEISDIVLFVLTVCECKESGLTNHLSDASLMAKHSGFKAPGLLFVPWVVGTTKN